MKIDFANLGKQYRRYKEEIDEAIQSVLDRSAYIMGEEVRLLEDGLCAFTGAGYAIGCGAVLTPCCWR